MSTRQLTLLATSLAAAVTATACTDVEARGDHAEGLVTVRGPHVAVVQHIQDFRVADLLGQLLDADPWKGALAELNAAQRFAYRQALSAFLAALRETANPDSPWHLLSDPPGRELIDGVWRTGKRLDTFLASKEYRGFMQMSGLSITCRDGLLVDAPGSAGLGHNTGYTPDPTHLTYHAGEGHPDGPTNSYRRLADGVTWTAGVRARLDEPMRKGGWIATGYDAPFIYHRVTYTLKCDGSYTIAADASFFPTATLYVNKLARGWRLQSRFVEFIRSGGAAYNRRGTGGNVAPGAVFATVTGQVQPCPVVKAPGPQPFAATTCTDVPDPDAGGGEAPVLDGPIASLGPAAADDWTACPGVIGVAAVYDPFACTWSPEPADAPPTGCRGELPIWDDAAPSAASCGALPSGCGLLDQDCATCAPVDPFDLE